MVIIFWKFSVIFYFKENIEEYTVKTSEGCNPEREITQAVLKEKEWCSNTPYREIVVSFTSLVKHIIMEFCTSCIKVYEYNIEWLHLSHADKMIINDQLAGVPLLALANKQDLKVSVITPPPPILERLSIQTHTWTCTCAKGFMRTVYREFFASGNFGENDALKVC